MLFQIDALMKTTGAIVHTLATKGIDSTLEAKTKKILNVTPTKEFMDHVVPLLLQKNYGEIIVVSGVAMVVIDNETEMVDLVKFEDFVTYAYKRVHNEGKAIEVTRHVWNMMFGIESPDYVVAISRSAIANKDLMYVKSLVGALVARSLVPEMDWEANKQLFLKVSKDLLEGKTKHEGVPKVHYENPWVSVINVDENNTDKLTTESAEVAEKA